MLWKKLTALFSLSLLSAIALADTNLPSLKVGVAGKKRGDIIAPLLDVQIAAWCDFDKQIVTTRNGVLCSYVGDKSATVAEGYTRKILTAKRRGPRQPKDLDATPYEMSEYGDEVQEA